MEEGIKWGMPHFMVGGKNVAGFAAFKAHCAFVIHGEVGQGDSEGMGGYGKIASLAELPVDAVLEVRVREVAQRVAEGGSAVKPKPAKLPKAEIAMPDDLAAALAAEPRAEAALNSFAPSHRREYLEWITGAKQPATRARRIARAVEWLAQGKKRNWKYESC